MSNKGDNQPSPPLIVQKSPDFRIVYSDIFNYRVSLTDISIVFSTLADDGDLPNSFVQTQQVSVVMALGQVKSLGEYLTMIVARYERDIGPINGIGKSLPSDTELDPIFNILKGLGTH
jgi:hypothetical protein